MVGSETKVKGFGLERSDLIAICVGVTVALVLYLEPQKSVSVVLACLLLFACCVAYLLFHWFAKWQWNRNARTKEKKVRLLAACFSAVILMALYGAHVWPQEDQTAKKIEQVLRGEEYDPQKLAWRFPLGYVVFRLENNDHVEFYKGFSLIEHYDFDWSKVKYLSNTSTDFTIQMPDIVEKSPTERFALTNSTVSGPKKVGWWMTYYSSEPFNAVLGVLDADKDGVVLVVGLRNLGSSEGL